MIYCPNCGGGLRFEIESQMMACDHCDSRLDPAELDYRPKDDAKAAQMFDSFVYVCPSCGAELMTTDKTDAIGFCPFCGGASMLFDRVRQQWRPDYVIPFQITKEQCKELYVKAAKRSFLTSKKYRDPALIEEFRGIYMPFWEFQAVQKGKYSMNGTHNTLFTVNEYKVSCSMDRFVEGYAHDASRAFDDRISENITPFDVRGHREFAPGYLSGFYADIGDVEYESFTDESVRQMQYDTGRELAAEPSLTENGRIKIKPETMNIHTEITDAKRVLYPVWFMSYRNKDKITYAAVNGQTGKVSADFPASPVKILLLVLLLGAALAALFFLLPSVKANMTLGITAFLLGIGAMVLRHNFKGVAGAGTGLENEPETIQFNKWDKVWNVIIIISLILALIVAFMDVAYNVISYAISFALGAELFLQMFRHIRFQVAIAKRRPPQFNKKGAEYDET